MIVEPFKFVEIKIHTDTKKIGMQMSGGADSTLVAYMYAYTIKKHKLPIKLKRITFGFGNKPDYFATSRLIQHSITELLDFDPWDVPYEFFYNHKSEHSVLAHIKKLYDHESVNYFVNGKTKNPPANEILDPTSSRILERDIPTKNKYDEIVEPFYDITKDIIIKQYIDLGIYETLFQKTQSCDANITTTKFPCGECWWCKEREWALSRIK